MAISKVILNGEVQMDVTSDTVTAGSMLSGTTATKNDGTKATGTISTKSSTDLTVSGATVTAPAGYYSANASKSVANGSVTAPNSISGTSATVSTGTNTLTLTKSVSVTPNVTTAGYISSGTAGSSSVSLTASVTTKAAATITPSTSAQSIAAGTYLTGKQTISAMPSGTAGTPTASKGTVSNHAISVTPSVTNTTGYITGGTKTGTAVSVSASELVSGTKSITENGTGIDVTNYASVDVAVPSGGEPEPQKQINFIDYDGTILHSYTKTEWQSVSSLPSNPSHSGLTAQGWNWTKEQIDAQLTAMPDGDVWVGQMYITDDEKTRIYVHLEEGRLHPYLGIGPNGTVVVDWGDGSSTSTLTGNSLSTVKQVDHTYASGGDYVITLTVSRGSFAFFGVSNTSHILKRDDTTTANMHYGYTGAVQKIELGVSVNIGAYAFKYCYSLKSITIPSIIPAIGVSAFHYCASLQSVTIPSGIKDINGSMFYYAYSLKNIAIPASAISFGVHAFHSCAALGSITIPSDLTTILGDAFEFCYALQSVTIPSGVTNISGYAFRGCYSLTSITIPSGVTAIRGYAFNACYSMGAYHIKPSVPPTLEANAFVNIGDTCKLYVPSASLEAYRTAENWSAYASYIVGE